MLAAIGRLSFRPQRARCAAEIFARAAAFIVRRLRGFKFSRNSLHDSPPARTAGMIGAAFYTVGRGALKWTERPSLFGGVATEW
jgi:hypothetical protein